MSNTNEENIKILAEELSAANFRIRRLELAVVAVCVEAGLEEVRKILKGDYDEV